MNYNYDESEVNSSGIYKTFCFDEGVLTLRIYRSLAVPFISLLWEDGEDTSNDAKKVAQMKNDFNFIMRVFQEFSIRIPKLTAIDDQLLHETVVEVFKAAEVEDAGLS